MPPARRIVELDLVATRRLAAAPDARARNGQYLTPPAVADLMVEAFADWPRQADVKILDPGAGTGTLGISLAERMLESGCTNVHLVAVELDEQFFGELQANLQAAAESSDGRFSFEIHHGDFLERQLPTGFDLCIMNPPYKKINVTDRRLDVRRHLVWGQPNLYALFIAEGAKLLSKAGRLVAITPRSMMSGPYFREIRKYLRTVTSVRSIRTFPDRKVFARDEVLQETVILTLNGGPSQEGAFMVTDGESSLHVSLPTGPTDVWPIPADATQHADYQRVSSWQGKLGEKFAVTTGPSVFFRSSGAMSRPNANACPYVWMNNVGADGGIEWPQAAARRPQYYNVRACDTTFLPNEVMVLVRRFSTRDDSRRLIAGMWNPAQSTARQLVVENRVNVIRGKDGPITRKQARELVAYLARPEVENWFRARSGTTQVNAADLLDLPVPPSIG